MVLQRSTIGSSLASVVVATTVSNARSAARTRSTMRSRSVAPATGRRTLPGRRDEPVRACTTTTRVISRARGRRLDPWLGAVRHVVAGGAVRARVGEERRRVAEHLAADTRHVLGAAAVLQRHQAAQGGEAEARVHLFAEGEADEGERREAADED